MDRSRITPGTRATARRDIDKYKPRPGTVDSWDDTTGYASMTLDDDPTEPILCNSYELEDSE